MKNQNLKLTKCNRNVKIDKNPNNGLKSKVELKSKNGWNSQMNQAESKQCQKCQKVREIETIKM